MSERSSCSYHPTKAAHFHCPKCGADFCPDCISRREREVYGTKKQFFFCPKCNIPAETLSAGSFVVPFWTRLPKFFVYPLHPKPLLLIALLSFAAMLLSWLPFVNLILWGILIKYCYAVLTNTARGNLRPPDLSYDVIWQDFGQAFKQIGLFLIVGIVDHEAGTRDLRRLGGLRRAMPLTFGVATVAALSMAGLPPMFGFLAKETLLASVTHPSVPAIGSALLSAAVVAAAARATSRSQNGPRWVCS